MVKIAALVPADLETELTVLAMHQLHLENLQVPQVLQVPQAPMNPIQARRPVHLPMCPQAFAAVSHSVPAVHENRTNEKDQQELPRRNPPGQRH